MLTFVSKSAHTPVFIRRATCGVDGTPYMAVRMLLHNMHVCCGGCAVSIAQQIWPFHLLYTDQVFQTLLQPSGRPEND